MTMTRVLGLAREDDVLRQLNGMLQALAEQVVTIAGTRDFEDAKIAADE